MSELDISPNEICQQLKVVPAPQKNKESIANQKAHAKQDLTEKYMKHFDDIIQETILRNNKDLYQSMQKFIFDYNNNRDKFDSQVPTSLVITSSESASSIDTQFSTLCDELSKCMKTNNIVLDDKKCGNIKSTIEHIMYKLKVMFGEILEEEKNKDEHSGDEFVIEMNELSDSSEEKEDEDMEMEIQREKDKMMRDSNYVSSLRNPSLGSYNMNMSSDQLLLNETLNDQDIEMTEEQKVRQKLDNLTFNKNKPDPSQIVTRNKKKHEDKNKNFKKIGNTQELDFQLKLQNQFEQNEIVRNESFNGVYTLIDNKGNNEPILVIIKNIKAFNSQVLNDLIHLFHKYRQPPYCMKLNLMLGVQNNNTDEFHLRVRIQNAVKMLVKKFNFPCMKSIIFEVIYQLIMNKKFILSFDNDVIYNLVEIINLYGMSILKFKRILRLMIADFFYYNDFFFIHETPISLLSKMDFLKQLNGKVSEAMAKTMDRFYFPSLTNKNGEKELEEYMMQLGMQKQKGLKGYQDVIIKEINKFVETKRQWFKAYEILEEIVTSIQEFQNDRERYIYKWQFMMNYLSKAKDEERLRVIEQTLSFVSNFKDFVCDNVVGILFKKKDKKMEEKKRESKFLEKELRNLKSRLDGSYTLEKQTNPKQAMKNPSKLNVGRRDKLLQVGKHESKQETIQQDEGISAAQAIDDEKRKQLLALYAPKNDMDFKNVLIIWLREFHATYLSKVRKDDESYKFQQHMFYLKWNDVSKKLNPDIGGNMTTAILNASKIFKCECCEKKNQFSGKVKSDGSNIEDIINPNFENMSIILEIYKYCGKDMNVVVTYDIFRKINEKVAGDKSRKSKYTQQQIRHMYLVALQNLRYMGYLSATRQNTFLFKKNFFGKPSVSLEVGKDDIENQENIAKNFKK